MANRNKVEQLIRILKGEEPEFEIIIIDRTSNPIMCYTTFEMENGRAISVEEADQLMDKK